MVNNYDWLSELSLLDFLRDYRENFNVQHDVGKRHCRWVVVLESGISFTEFTYQILPIN